ncbi:MAG: hypothetical protein JWP10_1604 [Nocardioidaceae bacterium]|nr:hypothetical protein [Nocardioidaceae bacterium]
MITPRITSSWAPRLAAIAAIALLMGCSGIPDSGKVVKVDQEPSDAQSATRFSPVGPTAGATPREIVRGFLEAMLAFPVSTGTAASFLTADAAKDWRPTDKTSIYSSIDVGGSTTVTGGRQLSVAIDHLASLDGLGRYRNIDATESVDLGLVKVKGEWRISTPPEGNWVSQRYFNDYFRPFETFYFDPSGSRLAAVPVYLVAGEGMPTELVRSLLRGPQGSLQGQARTYLPKDTTLRSTVTQDSDGLVEIQLRDSLATLTKQQQERASAQLVWTMRQVPGITGVRILAASSELNPLGQGDQSLDAWSEFAPRSGRGTYYALRNNRVVKLSGSDAKALGGNWGKDAQGATHVSVDPADKQIAAIVGAGKRAVVSRLSATSAQGEQVITGTNFAPPVWDVRNDLWLVDQASGVSRLRVVSKGDPREVDMGGLDAFDVSAMSLSPDGARFAAIASTDGGPASVYTGPILHNVKGEVTGLGRIEAAGTTNTSLSFPRTVVWDLTSEVTVVAETGASGPQVYTARIDGSRASGGGADGEPLLPTVNPAGFVTGGSAQSAMYVTDIDGALWFLRPRGSWERVAGQKFSSPVYTG